jgi:cytochrome c-type biogenesis protein CcmE
MKKRHKTLAAIAVGIIGISLATALMLTALRDNIAFFFSPTDVQAGQAPADRTFRLGGVVEDGSFSRGEGTQVHFRITDTETSIPVIYEGILPDLFREGQGVVAQGRLGENSVFHASQVLAKHDETYMPPEAAEALERAEQARAIREAEGGNL